MHESPARGELTRAGYGNPHFRGVYGSPQREMCMCARSGLNLVRGGRGLRNSLCG